MKNYIFVSAIASFWIALMFSDFRSLKSQTDLKNELFKTFKKQNQDIIEFFENYMDQKLDEEFNIHHKVFENLENKNIDLSIFMEQIINSYERQNRKLQDLNQKIDYLFSNIEYNHNKFEKSIETNIHKKMTNFTSEIKTTLYICMILLIVCYVWFIILQNALNYDYNEVYDENNSFNDDIKNETSRDYETPKETNISTIDNNNNIIKNETPKETTIDKNSNATPKHKLLIQVSVLVPYEIVLLKTTEYKNDIDFAAFDISSEIITMDLNIRVLILLDGQIIWKENTFPTSKELLERLKFINL